MKLKLARFYWSFLGVVVSLDSPGSCAFVPKGNEVYYHVTHPGKPLLSKSQHMHLII